MTKKQLEDYKIEPFCPDCGSHDIERLGTQDKDNQIVNIFECENCLCKWMEMYSLQQIIIIKETKE